MGAGVVQEREYAHEGEHWDHVSCDEVTRSGVLGHAPAIRACLCLRLRLSAEWERIVDLGQGEAFGFLGS